MTDSTNFVRFLKYLQGTLPADQVELLERELSNDEQMLRDLLQTAQDEATLIRWARAHGLAAELLLHLEHEQRPSVESTPAPQSASQAPALTPIPRRWLARWWRIAAASIALLLLVTGLIVWLTSGNAERHAATVVRVEAAAGDHVQRPVLRSRLAIGDVARFEDETAEIVFRSGARVVVQGPVAFTVLGDNSGRLERGLLSADVPSRAVGFSIETPSGRVVDRSTQFGVAVIDANRTDVEVFKGEVSASLGLRHESQVITFAPGSTLTLNGRQSEMTAMDGSLPQLAAVRDALKQKTIEASEDHFVLGGDAANVVQPSPTAPDLVLKRFHPRGTSLRRKAWIRFDLAGESIDPNAPFTLSFCSTNSSQGDAQRSHFVGVVQVFALDAGYVPPPKSLGTSWRASELTWNNAPGNRIDHVGEVAGASHLGDLQVDVGPGGAPAGTVFRVSGPRLGDVLQQDRTVTVILSVRSQQGFDPNLWIAARESPEFVGPTLTVQLKK